VTIRIGPHDFDEVAYDEIGDVLYLGRSEAKPAVLTEATPEGHAVQLDIDGGLVGLTLVNARWLIERDGKLVVTIPERIEASAGELAAVLTG